MWVAGAIGGALVVLLIVVAALDSGGDGGGGDTGVGGHQPGEISEILLYADPLDPVLSRVEFVASEEFPIEAVEFFGSKTGGAAVPESALIHLAGVDEPFSVQFDEAGRPDQLQTPAGAAFKIEYQGDMVTVHFLGADGQFGVESAPLDQQILDALDQVAAKASAAREGAEGEAKLVSASPVRSDRGPAPLTAAAEDDVVSLIAKAVHRAATFHIRAETADGDDAAKAICCFQIVASGEKPTGSAQISRTAGGMVVTVLHQVPTETILTRVQACDDWPWWAVGVMLPLAVIGSVFGGVVLTALGVGVAEAVGIMTGVSAISILSVGTQATTPSCVEMTKAELRAEYQGKVTTIELCPFGDQIEAFAPRCTEPVSYRPFDPARPTELGGFTFIVTLKDDVADLEKCNLGRTGSSRPPARSPRLVINATRGEDTSRLVPQRQDQPQPYFAPPGYVSKCGEPPPVVGNGGGTVEARGTFDQPFVASGVDVDEQVNEIALSFPAGGGDVTGEWTVVAEGVFREIECILLQTDSGQLEGTYDGGSVLSGTAAVTTSISVVSGCEDVALGQEGTVVFTWSGTFDGRQVTGAIDAFIGMPFRASVVPD